MLSIQTIAPRTLELLKSIAALPQMQQMRHVGGTSLALQYGHRQSVDLDFFGKNIVEREAFLDGLRSLGDIKITNQTENIIQLIINDIKVNFVDYSRYEWIDDTIIDNNICLASPKDIAAMKINAVMGRGTKKDFVDIFVLLQHFSLAEIMSFYRKKIPRILRLSCIAEPHIFR